MLTFRSTIQGAMMGLALTSIAAPAFADPCKQNSWSCPNNLSQCEWESCVNENGYEYKYRMKYCDGSVQTIENGKAVMPQEDPCGGEISDGSGGTSPFPVFPPRRPIMNVSKD